MRYVRKLGSAILLTSVVLAACSEDVPTVPLQPPTKPLGPVSTRLNCSVNVSSGAMTCDQASSGNVASLTVGGQGTYIFLKATNVVYTSGTQTFSADVTVQNLMAQKLGTNDGTTVQGVSAYIVDGPITTSGSGTITVQNADGTGTLTNTNQPFFLYNEILDGNGGVSSVKNWKFTVPTTVTTFSFAVLLAANIPEESSFLRFAVENGINLRIYKMFGVDSRNIFATSSGSVYRYNGTDWRAIGTALSQTFWGVSATSAKDVWVVGSNGTAARYNGTTWTTSPSTGTQQFLWGVWANTTTDVWAVGDSGAVFRFNGSGWAKTQVAAAGIPLRAIHGRSASDVWAVGGTTATGGVVYHWNGTSWTLFNTFSSLYLTDVYAISATDIWLSATNGNGAYHSTNGGTNWTQVTPPSALNGCDFTSISVLSASDVWFGTGCGDAARWNGTAIAALGAGIFNYQNSIYAASTTDVWMSAYNDRPYHYNGTNWREIGNYNQPHIYAMWGSSPSDVWAGTSSDVMWHRDFFGWTQSSSGLATSVYGMWGSASNNVWGVGPGGVTTRYNGTSWASVASGTTNDLNAVWGTSSSNVYAVGSGGTILKFGGSTWAAQTSNTTTSLFGVGGSGASDIWAVGSGGFITRFNGTTWASVSTPVSTSLYSVCANSASDAWAVGAQGKVVRYNGSVWSLVTMPATTANTLISVWCGSSSNVWVAALDGSLYHYNGTSWRGVPSGTGLSLWVVFGFGTSDLYAGGDYGFLVRGTR